MNINIKKIKLYRYLIENMFNLIETLPREISQDRECRRIWMVAFFKAINTVRINLNDNEAQYMKNALIQEDKIYEEGKNKSGKEELIEKKQELIEFLNEVNEKIFKQKMLEIKQILGPDYSKYENKLGKIVENMI